MALGSGAQTLTRLGSDAKTFTWRLAQVHRPLHGAQLRCTDPYTALGSSAQDAQSLTWRPAQVHRPLHGAQLRCTDPYTGRNTALGLGAQTFTRDSAHTHSVTDPHTVLVSGAQDTQTLTRHSAQMLRHPHGGRLRCTDPYTVLGLGA